MKLFLSDYVKVDGKIWFSAANYNGLFQYTPETKQTKLVSCFYNDEPGKFFMHSKILKYNSSIWMIPFQAKHIYEFDTDSEILNCYLIPEVDEYKRGSLFLEGEIIEDKLYLFPCRYKGIIIFDLNRREVEKIVKLDDSWIYNTSYPYVFKGAKVLNNKIYIAHIKKNIYEIIDMCSECKESVIPKDDFAGITHMFINSENIILVGYNGKIGVYSTNGEKKYNSYFESNTIGPKFYDICINKDLLFLTETDNNKIAIYNYITNQKREIVYPISEKKEFQEFWANVLFIKSEYDKIIFQNAFNGCVFLLNDYEIQNLGNIEWTITDEERIKIQFQNIKMVKEHYGYELKTFLKTLL